MNLILQAIKSMFRGVYSYIDKSRTHWDTRREETVEYIFDGNLEGREIIAVDSMTMSLVKIADDFPEVSSICDFTNVKITYSSIGSSQNDSTYELSPWEDCYIEEYGITGIDNAIFYCSKDAVLQGVNIPKGLYVYYGYVVGEYVSKFSFSYPTGELKKLDKKYLPDDMPITEQVFVVTMVGDNASNGIYVGYTPLELWEKIKNGTMVYLVNTTDGCVWTPGKYDSNNNKLSFSHGSSGTTYASPGYVNSNGIFWEE